MFVILNTIFKKYKLFLVTSFFIFFLIHKGYGQQIQNHLVECCSLGISTVGSGCQGADNLIKNIPLVWRGLCLSTLSMCCSKEFQNQQCVAGRQTAKKTSNCDESNLNHKLSSYTDCCKACLIGLAMATSGQNCSSNHFSFFQKDESFLLCCNEMYNENGEKEKEEHNIIPTKSYENKTNNDSKKHFILHENKSKVNNYLNFDSIDENDESFELSESEDICTKFNRKLCSHICENTNESYYCKCYKGYKLDDNKVTCSKIINNSDDINDDIDFDDGENVDDTESEFENFNEHKHSIHERHKDTCPYGYLKNSVSFECEDVNECNFENNISCKHNQYCFNTVGSYICMNIKSTTCPSGFRFNAKTEVCEDYNECEDNPCDEGYYCVNLSSSYECQKENLFYEKRKEVGNKFLSINVGRSVHTGKTKLSGDCGPGFIYKHNKCIDVDECLTEKNACDAHQICTNENGGYRCDCKIGFKVDSTSNKCIDINECQINNHNCLTTQRCDNTIGSYTCIRLQNCGTGYTLNAETGNCDDDDECELNTHDCPPGYDCRNTIGSFRCDRRRHTKSRYNSFQKSTTTSQPFILSSKIPILESKLMKPYFISDRPPTSISTKKVTPKTTTRKTDTVNKIVPFHSVSKPIYHENRTYYPFNYSNISNVFESTITHKFQIDTTKKPTFEHFCNKGFHKNSNGACVDMNECQIHGSCASHQKCINTNGSYRCLNLLQCSGGYKASIDGTSCVDIDECYTGEHNCGPDQICRNRIGGYICSCPIGHTINKLNRCVDVNECDHQVCPMNSECINTSGSYYCKCKSGFKKQHETDNICIDIDECQEIKNLCEHKCINFWGSYRCACNPGFELNLNNNNTCEDIDECEVHKQYQLCTGICNNVPGSYECSCPSGYELGTDKNSCRDIDECQTSDVCQGKNEICTNTRGYYKCANIRCPDGYTNEGDRKNRCRIVNNVCEGDECFNKPSSYTYNFITLVSNMIIPPQGRIFFSLRAPSSYEKIDFELKLMQVQAPAGIKQATIQNFSTIQVRNQFQLNLIRSLEGPQEVELELSMTLFMNGQPRGKSIAKVFVIVSQYNY